MTDSINANVVVSMPSQLFTMACSFKAVANGKIYIGKIDTDPVNPENQIQVYVENEDGSHVSVAQPIIINAAGYPVYNGQIAKFVTVQGHSMAVYDAYGTQQFYFPNVLKYDPDQFQERLLSENGPLLVDDSVVRVKQPLSMAIERAQHDKNADFVSAKDFGFKGDGTNDDAAVLKLKDYVNTRPKYSPPVSVYFPDGNYLISESLNLIRPVTLYSFKGATINYTGTDAAVKCGDPTDEDQPTADNFYQGDYVIYGIRFTGGQNAKFGIMVKSFVFTPKIQYCDFIDYGNKDSYDIYAQFENWDILIEGCYKKTFFSDIAIGSFISLPGKKTDGSAYDGGNSRVTIRDCSMTAYNNQDLGYFAYINCVKGRVIGGSAHHSTGGILLGPAASGTLIDGFYCEVSTQYRPWVISVLSDKTNPANYLFPQSVTVRNVYVNMHKEKIGNAGKLIGVMDADVKLRDWSVTDCQISNFENGQVLIDRNDLNEQIGNTYARIKPIFVPYNSGGGSKFIVTGKLTTAEDWSCGDIETGVWIPTVGGNASYYKQVGSYTRTGDVVTASFHIGITIIGSGDGYRIGGLPFLSRPGATSVGSIGYYNNLTTAVAALLPRVDAESNYITFTGATSVAGNMNVQLNVLGNNAEIIGSVTYFI
ncbi:phage tailspike protein [Escherichia coli]